MFADNVRHTTAVGTMKFMFYVVAFFAVTRSSESQLSMSLKKVTPGSLVTMSPLVSAVDLPNCLDSLSGVLEYYSRRRHRLDVPLLFGIFLTKVNLKWSLDRKHVALPDSLRDELARLVRLADELIAEARLKLHNSKETVLKDRLNKAILFLLVVVTVAVALLTVPESAWLARLPPLELVAVEELPPPMSYARYIRLVSNLTRMRPPPQVSDTCLAQIALSPSSPGRTRCKTEASCAHWLVRGSRTGYMLAHRLLWAVAGRMARGCEVLAMPGLERRLCGRMLAEAELIVDNGAILNDLLAEQITLCSLTGDARFLRRHLVRGVMAAQETVGCFRDGTRDDTCASHCGALSAAACAAATRYILQHHY